MNINKKKQIAELNREIHLRSKPTHCNICSKKITTTCNSHCLPRFILKEISENGELRYGQALIKNAEEITQTKLGINNAKTFHLLCKECDQRYFAEYENAENLFNFENLTEQDKNLVLSEISIKTHLNFKYQKLVVLNMKKIVYTLEFEKLKKIKQKTGDELDIEEHNQYLLNLKRNKNKTKNGFEILYCKLLNYKVGIAAQTLIAYLFDLDENILFNPNNLSGVENVNYFYLNIFPYKCKTLILFYIEKKRSKNVESLIKQFNELSEEEKLHFLFLSLIIYDEHFFINPSLRTKILTDRKICKLYKSTDGGIKARLSTKRIKNFRDYTNYLDEKYALKC